MSLYVVSTWLHVLAASFWLGSIAFLGLVLVPTLRQGVDPALRTDLLARSGRRLRTLSWLAFGVLIATGMIQLAHRDYRWEDVWGPLWQGPFGHALAAKLVLFAVTLGMSAWHDFVVGPRSVRALPGSVAAERLRRRASWLGRAVFLLGLGIVLCAVAMVR